MQKPVSGFPKHGDFVDLTDRTVLVTGGTGSFGSRFIRAVLGRFDPRQIVVVSRDEQKQFDMANALRRDFTKDKWRRVRFLIGDVRDAIRMRAAMRGIDYVVHAAAMKHVPIAEANPIECIRTNVMGAENVIDAAISEGVKRVIALSTDKACNPINLYGASKLAADKAFVAANNLVGNGPTRFSVVRYGNVMGSRGSVIPFFREMARRGDILPITDERMTRFWITLDQGVDFVLSCLASMQGGEIYVAKIPSMRITDLAEVIAPGLPRRVVGIRPGEKLHEVMISGDDARLTVELPDRYVIEPALAEFDRTPLARLGGTPVHDDFTYSSDSNPLWLDKPTMRQMLELEGFH